jgi:hypothetical protein
MKIEEQNLNNSENHKLGISDVRQRLINHIETRINYLSNIKLKQLCQCH